MTTGDARLDSHTDEILSPAGSLHGWETTGGENPMVEGSRARNEKKSCWAIDEDGCHTTQNNTRPQWIFTLLINIIFTVITLLLLLYIDMRNVSNQKNIIQGNLSRFFFFRAARFFRVSLGLCKSNIHIIFTMPAGILKMFGFIFFPFSFFVCFSIFF